MKGVLADSQDLADQSPLPIACSKPCWRATSPTLCASDLERDPHLALSTHRRSFWRGCAAAMPCSASAPVGSLPAMASAPLCCLRSPSIWWARRSRACRQPAQKAGTRSSPWIWRTPIAICASPSPPSAWSPPWSSTLSGADRAGKGRYRPGAAACRSAGAGGEQGETARLLPALARPLHLVYRPNSLKRERIAKLVSALRKHASHYSDTPR